jgi:hypothetical protein|tara:strand:- start:2881 stop:3057 length:177 start_codon:yes stop_codon:yes gene_type:complete
MSIRLIVTLVAISLAVVAADNSSSKAAGLMKSGEALRNKVLAQIKLNKGGNGAGDIVK